jgi:EmrB/QacA subfamily drug resistance transporter
MSLTRRITAADLYARRWQLLALTSVGAFMAPLDGAIVSVALKSIGSDLDLSFSASMWVQAVYLLVMAVLLIPLGRLADHYGRVRFYLLGVVVFTVGSLASALSMNGAWLIGSRAVQGVGGALLAATAAAIVTAVFPAEERGRALGINVAAVYVGLSIGPPLGGFLVDTLGWRWIFLVNLPIGVVVLLLGWLLLPRDERDDERVQQPDVAGAALLGLFLVCLLVPLTFAGQWGWSAARTIVPLAVAALGLAAFVAVEWRTRDPLVDLALLVRNRLFAAANLAALLNYMALAAIGVLTAVYLQVVQHRSPALTGWVMLGQPLMQAVLSPLSGRLSDRIGSRALTTGGMGVIAAGMVVLASAPHTAGLERIVVGLVVAGVGLAAFSAPNASAIMGSVTRDRLGLASSFLALMRVTGQALSLGVLGGIAASQLGRLGGRLIFTRGAGAAAGVLPAGVVSDFAHGYQLAMLTGAGLAVVGALVSLTRGPRAPDDTMASQA